MLDKISIYQKGVVFFHSYIFLYPSPLFCANVTTSQRIKIQCSANNTVKYLLVQGIRDGLHPRCRARLRLLCKDHEYASS